MRVMMDKPQLLERYERVGQWLENRGDKLHAGRIYDVLKELTVDHASTSVAFCGLFSAGKSSLINALCASNALQTGAVPTTATVHAVTLPGTNGRVQLLDTPGVDSTDEAHREATMNALHRADLMVLVADYQHVEAEENLELLRAFSEEGKRIVFVVNQVDKHLDFELTFAEFREHVEAALEDYGIELEHIFYTSTTESPYSELNAFRDFLAGLQNVDDATHVEQVQKRLDEIIRDAVHEQLAGERASVAAQVRDWFGSEPMDERELATWLTQEEQALTQLEEAFQQENAAFVDSQRALRESWVRLVELAQISPYETTEKGRFFVESLRPDFKVGFLRSAAKTAAEQTRRGEAFIEDLTGRVTNYLLVPLRNQIAKDIRQLPFGQDSWLSQLEGLTVDVTLDYVRKLVKPGALVSSQYPYQYVKDVVARIKRDVLGQLNGLVDVWFREADTAYKTYHADKSHSIEEQRQRVAALKQLEGVLRKEREWVDALCSGEVPNP
ncbi:dynamin family protein [Alicyclobacillus suci]|uniref:dynamin family protein n=1 Tax=Alicyclobacillus suci TaxID=2816080 RepID=UPI001A90942D|nr:dynamin family protein [Alicyclobacillus suci]